MRNPSRLRCLLAKQRMELLLDCRDRSCFHLPSNPPMCTLPLYAPPRRPPPLPLALLQDFFSRRPMMLPPHLVYRDGSAAAGTGRRPAARLRRPAAPLCHGPISLRQACAGERCRPCLLVPETVPALRE